MSNIFLSNYTVQAEATAINATSYFSGATLTIYSGTQPVSADTALSGNTALAIFTLPASGSNSVSNGVITFGAISSITAVASGTASFFRVTNGANTIYDGQVTTTGGGGDCQINSVAVSSGATVAISAMSFTVTK